MSTVEFYFTKFFKKTNRLSTVQDSKSGEGASVDGGAVIREKHKEL